MVLPTAVLQYRQLVVYTMHFRIILKWQVSRSYSLIVFYFFSVSQMAADVCENINVEFSLNINILLTDKYSIFILHLAKCLIAIMLTPFLKVYSTKETYTLNLKKYLANLLK
mgnify:CR=1 FL=1